MKLEPIDDQFIEALLTADIISAMKIIENVDNNNESSLNYEELISLSLDKIGEMWDAQEISLAQIYMSGNICEQIINKYYPIVPEEQGETKIGIAVLSDHHSLGMKIVSSIMRAKGYSLQNLGIGVSPEDLVHEILRREIEIILISTLMLPSVYKVREVKKLLINNNADHVRIIVGGAPFRLDPQLWTTTGADAFGKDAQSTIQAIKNIQGGNINVK